MRKCDAVITCLPSPAASDAVMQEMLPEIKEGKIWMEMSTTDQAEAERLGGMVIAAGGAAVDCPVSGGCHRADTGNISIFAGCDRATFDRILPLLKTMGRRILHTGDLGTASMLKVLTNYLATVHLVANAEALVTAKAAGMDLNTTYEAIKISSGNIVQPCDRKPGHPERLARYFLHHGPGEKGCGPFPEHRRAQRRAAGGLAAHLPDLR